MKIKDQLGNEIKLRQKPKRVISLVPSQSEYLWDMGLREELVGITKFCVHPDQMFQTVERVGGTKTLDLEKIRSLKPDLIIGNLEENEKSEIEILQKEFNVWMSDIYCLGDALDMMRDLASIFNCAEKGDQMIEKIQLSFTRIKNIFSGKSVAYFIWNKPYMCAAHKTFINDLLNHIGLKNVFGDLKRYPEITIEQIKDAKPDFCFLSSEPFPFKEKHVSALQVIIPHSEVQIVDGEMFSWYGSRLLLFEAYILRLRSVL